MGRDLKFKTERKQEPPPPSPPKKGEGTRLVLARRITREHAQRRDEGYGGEDSLRQKWREESHNSDDDMDQQQ
jgi:hypothetical protein